MKFRKKYQVDTRQFKNNSISLADIGKLFLESSNDHSESMGHYEEALRNKGYGWIIYKWSFKIHDLQERKDKVQISTWISSSGKLQVQREFQLFKENELLVEGSVIFILMDWQKKKPIPIPTELSKQFDKNEEAIFPRIPKIFHHGKPIQERISFIKKQDIDGNGHVNNLVYIQWLEESLKELDDQNHSFSIFRIHYLQELRKSEKVLIKTYQEENGLSFEIIGKEIAARAWCNWKND
ncbi:MAG: thioesterase [Tissierellia bacterium]|nr:thioesterase [Tissierellia bacterium]